MQPRLDGGVTLCLVLTSMLAPLVPVAAAKKKKAIQPVPRNFKLIKNGNDYYDMMAHDSDKGLVVAYLDDRTTSYTDYRKIFDEAMGKMTCLPRDRVRLLRVRYDTLSAEVLNKFHEVHKEASMNPLLRQRQRKMETPFVVLIGTEKDIPEPIMIHAMDNRAYANKTGHPGIGSPTETSNSWTLPSLVQWAKAACDVYEKRDDAFPASRPKNEL